MRAFALSLIALAALACPIAADAKKITYPARFKAKFPAVTDGKSVGVLNFEGRDGDNFAAALTSLLQTAQLDDQPILDVKTLDGLNFVSDGTMSKAEVAAAIKLGQKLGVKHIFTGTVMAAGVNTTNYTNTVSVCVESSGLFKCNRSENRSIPCQKIVGQYSVSPRAISVATGTTVYSEVISKQGEYSVCNGQKQSNFNLFAKAAPQTTASSPEGLLAELRNAAAVQIRSQIAPYNANIQVELKEKAAGLSKPDAQQFSSAIAFGNAGRMDRACSLFETLTATEANQANIALLYNLGVCQEVLLPDAPEAALEYYAKADQYLTKPDKMISDAFMRTKALAGEKRGIRN